MYGIECGNNLHFCAKHLMSIPWHFSKQHAAQSRRDRPIDAARALVLQCASPSHTKGASLMPQPTVSTASQPDQPRAAYGALAQAAESYGFDGVTVYNDMLYQPAWLPLREIARHTQRVRIGPAA